MKDYNNEILNDCAWFAEKYRGKNKQSGPHWSTIIRFTPLFDEATRLQQRVDTLEAYISDFSPVSMEIAKKETIISKLEGKINVASDLLESISLWFYKNVGNPDPFWACQFESVCNLFEPIRKDNDETSCL